MKIMSRLLTAILVSHFALAPQHVKAAPVPKITTEAPKKVTFSLVKQLVMDMKESPETYFSKEELSMKAKLIDTSVTNEVLEGIKKKLQNPAIDLSATKQEILAQLTVEQQNKLIELKYALSKVDSGKLDRFFRTAMRDGLYSKDLQFMYDSAYGSREKLEVLMQMLNSDMSLILTQNAKEIGKLDRAALLKQLDDTGSFLSIKDSKTTTIIIIVLTVAAAGLLTWGIMSATKTRYEKKTKEMNDDYDQREQQAIDENNQKIASLDQTFAERARLRDQGYTWQVCKTERSNKTAVCSYDHKSYGGEEVCVTNCLKNPAGDETGHVKTCLSAYIPNNCFMKNETEAGYDDGYDHGYDNGYNVGYDRAYDAAYNQEYQRAYDNAYSSAYNSGYNSGYNAGVTAGYNDGYDDNYVPPAPEPTCTTDCDGSMKAMRNLANIISGKTQEEDDRAVGYLKGFQEGYAFALQLKVGVN
ncbi:MAG: hypothetical protein ACJ76H_01305 [Bacteriovoracaceae bacterium]